MLPHSLGVNVLSAQGSGVLWFKSISILPSCPHSQAFPVLKAESIRLNHMKLLIFNWFGPIKFITWFSSPQKKFFNSKLMTQEGRLRKGE